ncbi:MAG: EAL domain-containing protein [Gammaproteobacteria bacterium]|nr:hypothetical protein [Gammaproteobacteria bacterium]
MPSRPQLKSGEARADLLPFASYAQVLRMLMPAVLRVGFYDAKGRTLWVSDGIEEPEFRMHLDLVLARFASKEDEHSGPYATTEQPEPIFVFPIRNAAGVLIGAVGFICRELPATAAYRRLEYVERLLAPFMQILSHAWASTTSAPRASREPQAAPSPRLVIPNVDANTPLPAVLRRALALATRSFGCAFGAVIAAERAFTLTHRASPDESDLTINAAVDHVRSTVLKFLQARRAPVLSNAAGYGRADGLPYKVLAHPLNAEPNRLAAVLIVFREKHAPDFTKEDLVAIAQVAAQIPASALKELLAPRTVVAPMTSVEPARIAPRRIAPSGPHEHVPPDKRASHNPAAPGRTAAAAPVQPRQRISSELIAPASQEVIRLAGMRSDMPMSERVRLALEQNAFDLYVQPITPLRDPRRAPRYEVLLRMNDGRALYAPHAFFAAAEESELMPELDQWVIRELLRTLKAHATTLRTSCKEFAVNVAAQTLLTDQFSDYVVRELKHSSIPPGLLVFEVSEGDAIEHQYSLSILAKRLHAVGCRIALDNCCAGTRTFDTLYKWPVSCLKIDGSLIRHIASNYRYESQVRAMVRMAQDMGLETVAECVESEPVRERLLALDVDYAQGYHFGRPQPLATLFPRPAA